MVEGSGTCQSWSSYLTLVLETLVCDNVTKEAAGREIPRWVESVEESPPWEGLERGFEGSAAITLLSQIRHLRHGNSQLGTRSATVGLCPRKIVRILQTESLSEECYRQANVWWTVEVTLVEDEAVV